MISGHLFAAAVLGLAAEVFDAAVCGFGSSERDEGGDRTRKSLLLSLDERADVLIASSHLVDVMVEQRVASLHQLVENVRIVEPEVDTGNFGLNEVISLN